LGVKSEQIGNVLVIELPQRLDAVGVSAVEQKFGEAVTAHKGTTLVDMSNTEFVASLALRMLLTNHKEVKRQGGELALCGLQPPIADIFRKSRFDTLFTIYPDREAALAAHT
jgi:anti-sigma B factor antagonist